MTLNTPRVNQVNVFDANYPYTFTVFYEGTQTVKNRAIIRDNETYDIIYDQIHDGLRLSHLIAANTLKNNKTYAIQMQVYDVNGNSSNLSEAVIFSCHTTPVFYFNNVNDGDIITASNLRCNLSFEQNEEDSIKEYKYYLYDENKNELSESESYYSLNTLSYVYYGLENLTAYYIRAIGKTVYGFDVDTGYIKINIQYNCIPCNMAFTAINKDGQVILTTNIISSDYDIEGDGNYELKDGELILDGDTIKYHVKDIDDFTLIIRAHYLPENKVFAGVISDNGNAFLSVEYIEDNYYAKLRVTNSQDENEFNLDQYVLYTDISAEALSDTNNNMITDIRARLLRTSSTKYDPSIMTVFEVHRKNNLYSLKAYYS